MTHDADLPGRLVDIGDTRLHVYEHGDPGAPPLLFVHGGPAQGAYDFVHHQAPRLSRALRLVGVDQRGALFSDPLRVTDTVTESSLVADLEALRVALGIDTWAVLGHSFGARVALRYAVARPGAVTSTLFENPAWDMGATTVCLATAALPVLEEMEHVEGVRLARELLADDTVFDRTTSHRRLEMLAALGTRRHELYVHERPARDVVPSTGLPEQIRARGDDHARQIIDGPELGESLLPLLGRLDVPALLLLGLYDHVTDDDSIELFDARVEDGAATWFEESAHFCHGEQPDEYARAVTEHVLASSG